MRARTYRFPAFLTATVLAAIALCGAFAPSAASAAGRPFPRLGVWWPNNHTQSAASRARYDWVSLGTADADHIAELRAANPDIKLFCSTAARALNYREDDYSDPLNAELRSVPLSWVITQVGSRLTSAVDANTTIFPVAETAKSGKTLFVAGDVLVIDNELLKITAVNGLNLTVKRGTRMGTPAAPHAAGTRIAAISSSWPGALDMDPTTNCPRVDVGHGPERWIDWNARRLQRDLGSADWDGILIDGTGGSAASLLSVAGNRSLDPDRSNTVITDYTAFNNEFSAGLTEYAAIARGLVGPDAVLLPNGSVRGSSFNGGVLESFSRMAPTTSAWRNLMFGPYAGTTYLELCAARPPSYAQILTYEVQDWQGVNPFNTPGWTPNYQRMRWGLCSALMGDGYFSYEISAYGHGTLGLMWFDEYDNAGAGKGYLGQPVGAARTTTPANADLLAGDGAFATAAQYNAWRIENYYGGAATKAQDSGALRIAVTTPQTIDGGVRLLHPVATGAGKKYRITLRAKATKNLDIYPKFLGTGQSENGSQFAIGTEWREYASTITSSKTQTPDLMFYFGGPFVGDIWFDDIEIREVVPEVWRRDYEGGIALVNAEATAQTVSLGGAFRKIDGTQVPSVNDGSLVTAVTLPAKDGIVLLREAVAPDTTPPAVSIVSPGDGTMVSGPVGIAADASSDVGVTKVEFRVDGVLVGSDTSSPYGVMWGAKGASSGSHRIEAKAYDRAGKAAHSEVSVTVGAASISTPPIPSLEHAPTVCASSLASVEPLTALLGVALASPAVIPVDSSVETEEPEDPVSWTPTTLTGSATRTKIPARERVRLSARLSVTPSPRARGGVVTLWRNLAGAWSYEGKVPYDPGSDAYVRTVLPPSTATYWLYYGGDAAHQATGSQAVTITAYPTVGRPVVSSPSRFRAGKTLGVSGRWYRKAPRQMTVLVDRKVGAKWSRYATARATFRKTSSTEGTYSAKLVLKKRGLWRVTVTPDSGAPSDARSQSRSFQLK